MHTWHLHIQGQVQGVGFRPFVYRTALDHQLNGWVNNSSDGVHIEFNGMEEQALAFCDELLHHHPPLARITRHRLFPVKEKKFLDFQIIHSEEQDEVNLLLTPDFAICPDCKKELHQKSDRRAQYPFITCTNCGPRFSIVRLLPYDRPTTTMSVFEMCPDCKKEYHNPLDRRYFSQTNSCPECSIPLHLFNNESQKLSSVPDIIIDTVCQEWKAGKVVAIKGIGGYLLTCSAEREDAVRLLRRRKRRPSKPFALMYPDVERLEKDVHLSKEALATLNSPVAPIVLLDAREKNTIAPSVAPGLQQLGVMLPYAPLFELLMKAYQKPIIATSGNLTETPIVYTDDRALRELTELADLVLTNERKIVVPQDDSVIRFTPFHHQRIIIRRSRGWAPTYIEGAIQWPGKTILAAGAMLKSTFTFLHQKNTYISQYLGDLSNYETEVTYQKTVQHFFQVFKRRPEVILADLHPGYPSTLFAQSLAKELQVPVYAYQHHKAHFAAVLGENRLLQSEEPILGVIWDGTGLGEDGHIWGGEFFVYENGQFSRPFHFDYFDFILGDKMAKEPRISALSACQEIPGKERLLEHKFKPIEWKLYMQMLSREKRLQTSSVGRLFDAAAALLDLMDVQTYEGEAAMRLEALAYDFFRKNGLGFHESYFETEKLSNNISTNTLMSGLVEDILQKKPLSFIAAKFHFSLITLIRQVAHQLGVEKIAFSGGVFQNSVLMDLIHHHLSKDFELFLHRRLSPNDENVSFGQLICYLIQEN